MQTRLHGFDGTARHGNGGVTLTRRAAAMLCAAVSTVALTGCTAPRIDGRAESEQHPSACESAYFAGEAHSRTMRRSDRHIIVRYLAAKAAQDDWTQVAAACQKRFAQGTIRAAQAEHTAVTLGALLGRGDGYRSVSSSELRGADGSELGGGVLGALSVAEDRAGFVMEILAAQNARGASLHASDDHKTAGQLLFTLSGLENDPRRKVYDITGFIGHTASMTDSQTGLSVPTIALTEIDCAREQLKAIDDAQNGGAASDAESASTSGDQQSAQVDGQSGTASSETAQSGDDATGSSSSATTSSATTSSGATSSGATQSDGTQPGDVNESLYILSQLIASRITTAFSYGYPDTDAALFE
ncbi:hypothetical protein [Bifidobacterium leontopitheci]|uniref:Uncharacterized protein n=1 Tax=Bifidobacterium leontopitheci TaxID=2650774 RepID=A0A6I1GML1_9BIFI|nr:hypothetical protein [Bifidobacterium leontopitheci]KAB7790846.1 hypothetical protein F7D09_0581 [Bifidobacterium leontopitheci]